MQPIVTVVIPFYNCPYIDQAISSVLAQTYDGHIEIIVVDDGSTLHQNKLAPFMSRIVYLSKANGGTASALNYGMSRAAGKYVTWLSSDDLYLPHKILRQVKYMEEHTAQISFTDFDTINEHNEITEQFSTIKFPTEKAFASSLLRFCPVNGCTVMMTKHLFLSIGGFNQDLPYTHDYDLWVRVVLNRISFPFINETLTLYRRHSGMGTVRHLDTLMAEFHSMRDYYTPALQQIVDSLPG